MDNRLCTFLHLGTETGRQSLPCQDPSPARGKMPPFKGGERSLLSKCLHPDFHCYSGHVCLVIPPLPPQPPNERELGETTLSDYDYDSNEDADYEPSESEDSDDELEFNSDASVSEDSEVEGEEEVLVMEERVEEDAKIQEFSIYLTLLNCLVLLMSPAKN